MCVCAMQLVRCMHVSGEWLPVNPTDLSWNVFVWMEGGWSDHLIFSVVSANNGCVFKHLIKCVLVCNCNKITVNLTSHTTIPHTRSHHNHHGMIISRISVPSSLCLYFPSCFPPFFSYHLLTSFKIVWPMLIEWCCPLPLLFDLALLRFAFQLLFTASCCLRWCCCCEFPHKECAQMQ